jgi:hypothetical protein
MIDPIMSQITSDLPVHVLASPKSDFYSPSRALDCIFIPLEIQETVPFPDRPIPTGLPAPKDAVLDMNDGGSGFRRVM